MNQFLTARIWQLKIHIYMITYLHKGLQLYFSFM